MASGFGIHGNVSRCYPFFKVTNRLTRQIKEDQKNTYEHQKDYVDCMQSVAETEVKKCFVFRDDYFECLHHHKEVFMIYDIIFIQLFQFDRKMRIEEEIKKQQNKKPEDKPTSHH